MIRVLVDSSADYTIEELQKKNIILVPLTITVDDEINYQDEVELGRKEIYQLMVEQGRRVKTAQPSPEAFMNEFEKAKEAGDEIICILLSSALSGTYQAALLAKDMVGYDKIYVIDSLSATCTIQFMADRALDMIKENRTAKEIVDCLEEVKGRIKIHAALDTLKYLYLGGRVSKTTAIVADAVSVKPGITLTTDGKVLVEGKYLGVGRAIKELVKMIKEKPIDPEYPIYMLYSYSDINKEKLKKAVTEAGIKISDTVEIGATLGVHVGPGAFGFVYVEK